MEKEIYLAGGCFWGVEAYYKKLKGIESTCCGYANGDTRNPKYEDLKHHLATHAETVKIIYNNESITLTKILEHFLRIINPYEINHQGEDFGLQYRTGVYYINNGDAQIINDYFGKIDTDNKFKIEVKKLENFFKAEDYHQDYLTNNPHGYCHIDFSLIKKEERK